MLLAGSGIGALVTSGSDFGWPKFWATVALIAGGCFIFTMSIYCVVALWRLVLSTLENPTKPRTKALLSLLGVFDLHGEITKNGIGRVRAVGLSGTLLIPIFAVVFMFVLSSGFKIESTYKEERLSHENPNEDAEKSSGSLKISGDLPPYLRNAPITDDDARPHAN